MSNFVRHRFVRSSVQIFRPLFDSSALPFFPLSCNKFVCVIVVDSKTFVDCTSPPFRCQVGIWNGIKGGWVFATTRSSSARQHDCIILLHVGRGNLMKYITTFFRWVGEWVSECHRVSDWVVGWVNFGDTVNKAKNNSHQVKMSQYLPLTIVASSVIHWTKNGVSLSKPHVHTEPGVQACSGYTWVQAECTEARERAR